MRAIVLRRHGGPEVLRVEQVPDPLPQPDEALIRVKACSLNHSDIGQRQGPGPEPVFPWGEYELPRIPGGDVAGVVEAVGVDVAELRPGDPVVVYGQLYCGRCPECAIGETSRCLHLRLYGKHRDGGLAELTTAPARNLVRIPAGYPFEQAAAVPVAYTTAWRMLITVAELRPGEDVLIVGIGGGVASAALQIALRAGARVFAASRSDQKLARARALGASATVNLANEDFSEWALSQTDGRGVDLVVDPVGAATWPLSIRSLARGGRLVICGASSGNRPNIDIRELYQRHRKVLGAPMGSLRDLQTVVSFVTRGEIAPVIDRVLPLEEVAEGHRALEAGEQFGKIVIRVQP